MRALGGETAWIYWKFVVMMSGFAPVALNVMWQSHFVDKPTITVAWIL